MNRVLRIRFTARGAALSGAAMLLLGTGFRYGYPELVVLGTAAAGSVAVALGYLVGQPGPMVSRSVVPDRVARGDPVTVTLRVQNRARLRWLRLTAEDHFGVERVPVPELRIGPGHHTALGYRLPARRRGVVAVGPLRIVGRDALGLAWLDWSPGDTDAVWVRPRIHPLALVPPGATRSPHGRLDGIPYGSTSFDSLRSYVAGDELRRVHWRTSARVGALMVREYFDTRLSQLVVLLDNRAVAHPGRRDGTADSFEAVCEAAASVLAAADRERLPATLVLVTPEQAGTGADQGGTYPDHGRTSAERAGTGGDRGGTDAEWAASRRAALAGSGLGYLDILTTVPLRWAADGVDQLRWATGRLTRDRPGDTLLCLTGPGCGDDLDRLAALRGNYPTVLVGILGENGSGETGSVRAGRPDWRWSVRAGVPVLSAVDGAAFAAGWNAGAGWSGGTRWSGESRWNAGAGW